MASYLIARRTLFLMSTGTTGTSREDIEEQPLSMTGKGHERLGWDMKYFSRFLLGYEIFFKYLVEL